MTKRTTTPDFNGRKDCVIAAIKTWDMVTRDNIHPDFIDALDALVEHNVIEAVTVYKLVDEWDCNGN